jgi:uncharacterized protein YndB with AHSA1/START domain
MSCNEPDRPEVDPREVDVIVERHLELPADPQVVWEELPAMLGDQVELVAEPGGALHVDGPDGERVGVVQEAEPAERLSFRWIDADGDGPASEVEIMLETSGIGTILHLRETRLDGAYLERSVFQALARA